MCIVVIHEPAQDKTGLKYKQIFFGQKLYPGLISPGADHIIRKIKVVPVFMKRHRRAHRCGL